MMMRRALLSSLIGVSWMGSLLMTSSCSRSGSEDQPIEITTKNPLQAALGSELDWTFDARRGSRQLRIIDITFDNLPLGMRKISEPKSIRLKGKVLTRDLRTGLIRVTAYDEKACDESYERLKKMATAEVKSTGNTSMTIPVSPCKLDSGQAYTHAAQFMGHGYFNWTMIDGADALPIESYPKFIAEHLFKSSFQAPPDGMVEIPSREAPDSGDVTLGLCAARPRKQCGKDPSCLWGLTSCISKDVTGRIPSEASLATGTSQGGTSVIINGEMKQ
jgi:hypothetical protein